ncbi:MAG: hypothetical protein BWX80_03692 [Candidatus Hydrogenedentes bacterium ADurb.Bin101]|nr:MAG: hypothetical protein BWX80_03692 [Candidatus Hydrogenedentes bacterium ADurb.Bin101]
MRFIRVAHGHARRRTHIANVRIGKIGNPRAGRIGHDGPFQLAVFSGVKAPAPGITVKPVTLGGDVLLVMVTAHVMAQFMGKGKAAQGIVGGDAEGALCHGGIQCGQDPADARHIAAGRDKGYHVGLIGIPQIVHLVHDAIIVEGQFRQCQRQGIILHILHLGHVRHRQGQRDGAVRIRYICHVGGIENHGFHGGLAARQRPRSRCVHHHDVYVYGTVFFRLAGYRCRTFTGNTKRFRMPAGAAFGARRLIYLFQHIAVRRIGYAQPATLVVMHGNGGISLVHGQNKMSVTVTGQRARKGKRSRAMAAFPVGRPEHVARKCGETQQAALCLSFQLEQVRGKRYPDAPHDFPVILRMILSGGRYLIHGDWRHLGPGKPGYSDATSQN